MNKTWMRLRWLDFRMGHSVYLIFLLSFANFILIFHRLLIERVEFLNDLLGELWVFVVLFGFVYLPVAMLVGRWHRKTQMSVEMDAGLVQARLQAKIYRTMIDIQTGKATKAEIEAMIDFLKKIESKE